MLKVTKIVAVLILSTLILVACGDDSANSKVSLELKGFRQGSNYPGLGYPPQDQVLNQVTFVYAILSLDVKVPVDATIKDQKKNLLDDLTKYSLLTEYSKLNPQLERDDMVYSHTMKAVQEGNNWHITGDLIYVVIYDPADQVITWDDKIQGEVQHLDLQNRK